MSLYGDAGGSASLVLLPGGQMQVQPLQEDDGSCCLDDGWQDPDWGPYTQQDTVRRLPVMVGSGFGGQRAGGDGGGDGAAAAVAAAGAGAADDAGGSDLCVKRVVVMEGHVFVEDNSRK